jgi:hypothetical protein
MTGEHATHGSRRDRGVKMSEFSFLYSTFRPRALREAFHPALGVCGYLRPPFTAFWAHWKTQDAVMTIWNGEYEMHRGRRTMVYTYVDDGDLRVSEYDDFGLWPHSIILLHACSQTENMADRVTCFGEV